MDIDSDCFINMSSSDTFVNDTRCVIITLASLAPNVQSVVFISICGVIGLFGNIAIVFFYSRRLNVVINVYIFYLAIVDLLATVITITNNIIEMVLKWYSRINFICQTSTFLEYLLLGIPYAVVLVVAVDRYRRICYPLGWQFDRRRAVLACGFATFWAFVNALPTLFLFKWRKVELKKSYRLLCQIAVGGDKGRYAAIFGIFIITKTAVRMLLYAILYGRIIHSIRKHLHFRATSACHQGHSSAKKIDDGLTKDKTRTFSPRQSQCSEHSTVEIIRGENDLTDISSTLNRKQVETDLTFPFPNSLAMPIEQVDADGQLQRISSLITEAYSLQSLSKSYTTLRPKQQRKLDCIRVFDIKATKIMIVLTLVMAFSVIPYHGHQIVRALYGDYTEEDVGSAYGWYRIIWYSPYINIPANFFIYCYFHADFRRWIATTLKCS